MTLELFPYSQLAADVGPGWDVPRSKFPGITLAQNVRQRHQVDELLPRAQEAGGQIVKPANDTGCGRYGGYFADPDGCLLVP
ncbi:MAG: VOC family protein [Candidatus Dormibacteria bacterium]